MLRTHSRLLHRWLLLGVLGVLAVSPPARPAAPAQEGAVRFRELTGELRRLAGRVPGSAVAFWVEDRVHGRKWALDPDRSFLAASLLKVPIAAMALERWEKHPEAATPELRKRVWRMVAESHNSSADRMTDYLGGFAAVTRFCREHGWARTRMGGKFLAWKVRTGPNLTSARDMAAILRVIDDRKLISEDVSKSLWRMLRDQKLVQRIPAGLPKNAGIRVGNKTGTMKRSLHDVAIVRGPGVHYLLVILTENPRSNAAGDAYCREVSRTVYRHLKP
jgi:beta-lactamase class A